MSHGFFHIASARHSVIQKDRKLTDSTKCGHLSACWFGIGCFSTIQALFCQSKCLSYVHQLIDVRIASGADTELTTKGDEDGGGDSPPSNAGGQGGEVSSYCTMSAIQSEIACKALDLLLVILQPEGSDTNAQLLPAASSSTGGGSESAVDPKRAERQAAVSGAAEGTLSEMVAHVGFSRADDFSGSTMACRERAMRVTGAMVDGHATNQYQMGEVQESLLCCKVSLWWMFLFRLEYREQRWEVVAEQEGN